MATDSERQKIGPDAPIWSARRKLLALDGGGTREEDALFQHKLTGHFRWKV